ncbi:ejaculatory bulb-specific protein 3-like, partial [Zerene cesonia]|uniref:ejaculatory bulb-specific protein 3-like n=1 Tax=Zerene cesonia TaxID=33412 RepID=UPI0018E56A21
SIFILLLVFFGQCYCDSPTYTTKYDNVNLDEVLSSERLLNGYVNCLLDKGPCTPDGKELRRNLPDAIQNDCKKCTERQREGADKVMQFIIDNRPEDWKKLEEKFNDNGSYRLQYISRKKNMNATVSD